MKRTMMLTLAGFFLHAAAARAADTVTMNNAVVPDTQRSVETTLCLKDPGEKKPESGGIYFGWGGYYLPFKKFNTVLAEKGIHSLSEFMPSFTCGFFGAINDRSQLGPDFEYFWSQPASAKADSNPVGSVKVSGYQIGFKGAYAYINRSNFTLSSTYGAGYYSHTYDFQPQEFGFNDIFKNGSNSGVQLRYNGLVLTTGVSIKTKWKFEKETMSEGMAHQPMGGLSFEGGIHFYPLIHSKIGNRVVDDAPQMSSFGVYTKLCLDLGEKQSSVPKK